MMRLALDASVCLKWFLHERGDEPDSDAALDLHGRALSKRIALVQPTIWRAEVASGLARLLPVRALMDVDDLMRIEAAIVDDTDSLLRAAQMAIDLRHHLFDTIYHAVAIEHGIDLVTADEHYYRKARRLGNIVLLRDWQPPQGVAEEPAAYRARARKTPARGRKKRR
jgi:predicted nucleic acid-binding protein